MSRLLRQVIREHERALHEQGESNGVAGTHVPRLLPRSIVARSPEERRGNQIDGREAHPFEAYLIEREVVEHEGVGQQVDRLGARQRQMVQRCDDG